VDYFYCFTISVLPVVSVLGWLSQIHSFSYRTIYLVGLADVLHTFSTFSTLAATVAATATATVAATATFGISTFKFASTPDILRISTDDRSLRYDNNIRNCW